MSRRLGLETLLLMFAIGDLPAWAEAWVDDHLMACNSCREFVEETLGLIDQTMQEASLDDEPDEPEQPTVKVERPALTGFRKVRYDSRVSRPRPTLPRWRQYLY